MKSKHFIKTEINKGYLITVNETALNRYTCVVYGVKLIQLLIECEVITTIKGNNYEVKITIVKYLKN